MKALRHLAFLAIAFVGSAQSTVQFTAARITFWESGGTLLVNVERSAPADTTATVDFATADGTAAQGVNYIATSGTITFAPGETRQVLPVAILNDGLVNRTRNFRIALSNPHNAALGSRPVAVVDLNDNDAGLQFILASSTVDEGSGAVVLGIVRGDDGVLPVTVDFSTLDSTAIAGIDYTATNGTLSFAPTEHLKLISIPILNDGIREANKSFRVSLSNSIGATLGGQSKTSVTIQDNDQGFLFVTNSYILAEDVGRARIEVLRGTDATQETASVEVATVNGSALDGLDFTGMTNTVTFSPGEQVKRVEVSILNDGLQEPNKQFRLTLRNPSENAAIGTRATTTVILQDNDPGLGFAFAAVTNTWPPTPEVAVTVVRGNDQLLGAVTVNFTTSDLTARAGIDYQSVSGTLSFQENETVNIIRVPLLRARAPEGTRTFRVSLSDPTGGIPLGLASASVSIVGSYFTAAPPLDTALSIHRASEGNTLTWVGEGKLHKADRVDGPWQTLTNARSPHTVQSPIPSAFYEVTRPRPAEVYVPSSYNEQTPTPLVLLLHGYGGWGSDQENYMKFLPLAESRGFLYCHPDGTLDVNGNRFWNSYFDDDAAAATAQQFNVDDVAYLRELIQEIGRHVTVDPKRIYLIGHSNGSMMAYRMACETSDLIAAIAALAGMMPLEYLDCQPSGPVNILHIHGTADEQYGYWGGAFTNPPFPWNSFAFPGVLRNLQAWAIYNGAGDPFTESKPTLDLTLGQPGLDSIVTRYTTAPPGGAVELWTIGGGHHSPLFNEGNSASDFAPRVVDWLLAHPKP
ncbi:MAG: alpha/beta fold hydrolase [Verrucomicrobiales bacterium]|nr:alpha/beta fold hydrolase [Verrucomicrobiales bacterium]